MSKKETTNPKEVRNQNYEAKKMNNYENLKKKKDKDLPWWVELLFVQIGLPDKLLIKILKTKKTSKEFIKNEKKSIIIFSIIGIKKLIYINQVKDLKNKEELILNESIRVLNECFDLENKNKRTLNKSIELIEYCLEEYKYKNWFQNLNDEFP